MFNLKAFNGSSSGNGGQSSALKSFPVTTYSSKGIRSTTNDANGPRVGSRDWWERNDGGLSRSESEEYIIQNNDQSTSSNDGNRTPREGDSGRGKAHPLEIWQSKQVDIESLSPATVGERDLRREQMGIYDGTGSGGEFESQTRIVALGREGSVRRSESSKRDRERGL